MYSLYQYATFNPSSAIVYLPVENSQKNPSYAPSVFELLAFAC